MNKEWIKNPKNNRPIQVGGKTYQKLLDDNLYTIHQLINLPKIDRVKSNTTGIDFIHLLPQDIIINEIIPHLNPQDLISFISICKSLSQTELSWESVYKKHYNLVNNLNYKNQVFLCIRLEELLTVINKGFNKDLNKKHKIITINDLYKAKYVCLSLYKQKHEHIKLWHIGILKNLDHLFVTNMDFNCIPPSITNLINLTKLRIYSNKIKEIPPYIVSLNKLTNLSISDGCLEFIPDYIGELTNLTELSLCNNRIQNFPAAIGQLTNLRTLMLGDNQISVIPTSIGNLKNLGVLYLAKNNIEIIPEEIGALHNLYSLGLRNNNIKVIPKVINDLRSLRYLALDVDNIEVIPEFMNRFS